jgi:hypothetical protein
MRMFGWVLGGIYVIDGVLGLVMKANRIRKMQHTMWKRVPSKIGRTMEKATAMNDVTLKAWAINNLIAGLGLVTISTLAGRRGTMPAA